MSLIDFIKKKKDHVVIPSTYKGDGIIRLNEELLMSEYESGVQLADGCMIRKLDEVFSWKRGFQNCFTGYPNDGKTIFTLFLMTVKSLRSDWKWSIWSPEMKSGTFMNGKVEIHYNDLINEIIWMVDGRTPYKHIAEKYRCERIPVKDYLEIAKWVKEHFITIDPKDRKPKDVYNLQKSIYENEGFDGVLIDPFKNLEHDIRMRDDIYMEDLFATFKDLGVTTNTVMNWIAHPKANIQRTKKVGGEEVLMPCDQYMLNGGAAWDNSMDGIYSVFRPNLLTDVKDKWVTFFNLKQRKQEITTERGACSSIYFDIKRRRYIFDGYDPIDLVESEPGLYKFPTDNKTDFTITLPYKEQSEGEQPF